jgi:RimJ/RimL family protein N-acetyltransferase
MGAKMSGTGLFQGKLVRLSSEDPQVLAEAISRWNQNSQYMRLLDSDPVHLLSAKKIQEWFEKDLDSAQPQNVFFSIRVLADDSLIGFIAFDGINWIDRDTFVAIGIGEPA